MYPVLNIVDHGANFQTAVRLRDHTASEVSRAFTTGWVRIFGNPEVVLTTEEQSSRATLRAR